MNNYQGVIIEESLINKDVLKNVQIASTKIERVTDGHKTPWISQWTLHTIQLPEAKAQTIANEICRSLDSKYSWYADFKNETHHYIIFHDRIFYINRKNREEYLEAKRYGISLGIPEHQVDFSPDDKIWKR